MDVRTASARRRESVPSKMAAWPLSGFSLATVYAICDSSHRYMIVLDGMVGCWMCTRFAFLTTFPLVVFVNVIHIFRAFLSTISIRIIISCRIFFFICVTISINHKQRFRYDTIDVYDTSTCLLFKSQF